MRSKANHLLTYVNDTNDVKEALNQWQASSTAFGEEANGTADSLLPWASSPLHGPKGLGKSGPGINSRSMSVSDCDGT
jgi:hypothetical protein